jgi:hypothetical protein
MILPDRDNRPGLSEQCLQRPDTTPSPTATVASQTISAGTHVPKGTITRFTIE